MGISGNKIVGGEGTVTKGFVFSPPDTFTIENFVPCTTLCSEVVTGINEAGDTCGFYTGDGIYGNGTSDIGGVVKIYSGEVLLGLNNRGQAAGYLSTPYNSLSGAIVVNLQSGKYHTLTVAGATYAEATGINDYQQVSGFYTDSLGQNHGFLLTGQTLTPLDYPGPTLTEALGLNNSGAVVGYYNDAANLSHGFIYQNGGFQDISAPNGANTYIYGVSQAGVMVGYYTEPQDRSEGLVVFPSKSADTARW